MPVLAYVLSLQLSVVRFDGRVGGSASAHQYYFNWSTSITTLLNFEWCFEEQELEDWGAPQEHWVDFLASRANPGVLGALGQCYYINLAARVPGPSATARLHVAYVGSD